MLMRFAKEKEREKERVQERDELESLDERVKSKFSLIPVVENTEEIRFIREFELDKIVEDLLLSKVKGESRNRSIFSEYEESAIK